MHNSFLNDMLNKYPDKPNQNEAPNFSVFTERF